MARRILVDPAPLRESRDFRLLFIGQLVSTLGSQLTVVAIPFQVYEQTHSSFQVGAISIAQLIPLVVGSLIGGSAGDAIDRRTMLLVSSAALALTSGGLALNALAAHPALWALYVISAVAAGLTGFANPARNSIVPALVGHENLVAALSFMQVLFQVGTVAGPAVAGLLIGHTGVAWVYGIDSITFIGAIVATAMMRPIPPTEGADPPGLRSIVDGIRFLRGRQVMQGAYLIDINAMVFGMPRALFPAIGLTVLHGGPSVVGYLFAAPGVGALLGALTTGWVNGIDHRGRAVIVAVIIWGVRHHCVRVLPHAVDHARPARRGRLGRRDLGGAPQHDPPDHRVRAVPEPDHRHPAGGGPGRPAGGRPRVGRRGHAGRHAVLGRLRWDRCAWWALSHWPSPCPASPATRRARCPHRGSRPIRSRSGRSPRTGWPSPERRADTDPRLRSVPFLEPKDMIHGEPLPGWNGHFFHAENMTFAHYEIAAGSPSLHEHHHGEEEVWNVVDGEIVLAVGGEERTLRSGDAAVDPARHPAFGPVVGACQRGGGRPPPPRRAAPGDRAELRLDSTSRGQTLDMFSNRAYWLKNARCTEPVGPLRCLATMISASPRRSIGMSGSYCSSR